MMDSLVTEFKLDPMTDLDLSSAMVESDSPERRGTLTVVYPRHSQMVEWLSSVGLPTGSYAAHVDVLLSALGPPECEFDGVDWNCSAWRAKVKAARVPNGTANLKHFVNTSRNLSRFTPVLFLLHFRGLWGRFYALPNNRAARPGKRL